MSSARGRWGEGLLLHVLLRLQGGVVVDLNLNVLGVLVLHERVAVVALLLLDLMLNL
jgi:hypothetical protein